MVNRSGEFMKLKINLMRVINVVGACPNIMKTAPVLKEMKGYSSLHPFLIHTGQYNDSNMSDVFLRI